MALHSAVCLDTLDKGNKMATLSDFYLGDPRLNQYYLGSGVGATRFNQNVRPTTRFMSRGRGPESLYLNNMGVFAPTQMGDFNPSAGILGMDMPRLRFDPQIQPSRMPVVVEDRMAQDNPNYRAMAALEPVAAQAEPAAAQAEPAQEAGAAPRRTLGLLGDMFGGASALDEYMTPEQRAQMQNQGVMAAAMQLLASSGPSRVPVGLGQALREAYGAGQKGYTAAQQNLLQSMTMKQKMDEYKRDIADQKAYREYLIGGGQVGAQPAGVVTPEQAINAPGGQVSPTVARAAMIGTEGAAMPVAAAAAPTGFASLTQEQRMILSRLPAKEGYKEALRLMEQKTESVPDDIKKLKALNLPVTLENLQSLKQEASPVEVRLLKELNLPLTFDNVVKLRQAGAAQTSVKVDTGDKTRAVEINKDIVAEMGSLTAQARAAKETLMNVDRVLPALDKAITGPLADYRTTLTRVGQYMGITGKDTNEILANTQNVVQGLAQQELNAASYTKGQGTLTGPEREMLKRSAAGDQNMSAAELRTALIAAQKMAQYRMGEQQQYLSKFSALPGSEQYVPFYTVTPYQPAGSGNVAQNAIDAEIARRAQQQRGGGMR
jgi:hypothetical protein